MGVKMPSKEILQNCWNSNDDGAGFAFAYDGLVYIKKGFMTFDTFWEALTKADERYHLDNLGVLLHFRIATHGGVIPAMTHPFPIVSDSGILQKLEYQSQYAVVHNGIISLTGADARREPGMSDTAVFIRDYLSLIAQNRQWFRRKCNVELIEKLIGSKMAILNERGEIIHTSGFIEDNGVYYSNESYKTLRVRTHSYNSYANGYYGGSSYTVYDDEDDYYENLVNRNFHATSAKNNTTSYNNPQKLPATEYKTYGLMFADVGDTIDGDFNLEINTKQEADYAVDEFGGLYYIYRSESHPYSTYYFNYEYVGSGWLYNGGKERAFRPNVFVGANHFIGGNVPSKSKEENKTESLVVID